MTDRELILALRTIEIPDRHACFGCGYEHSCGIHGCVIIKEAINRIEAAQQSNNSLTMDELREMDGEPVWGVFPGMDSRYMIIQWHNSEFFKTFECGFLLAEEYGKTWLAYRRKPEKSKKMPPRNWGGGCQSESFRSIELGLVWNTFSFGLEVLATMGWVFSLVCLALP